MTSKSNESLINVEIIDINSTIIFGPIYDTSNNIILKINNFLKTYDKEIYLKLILNNIILNEEIIIDSDIIFNDNNTITAIKQNKIDLLFDKNYDNKYILNEEKYDNFYYYDNYLNYLVILFLNYCSIIEFNNIIIENNIDEKILINIYRDYPKFFKFVPNYLLDNNDFLIKIKK